jgi:23S rRNA (guanosine2251-2'-O)-methyltransferase
LNTGLEIMSETNYTIYGIHAVDEALDSGKEISKIIVARESRSEQLDELISRARKMKVPVQQIPRDSSAFPRQRNHQGVVAYLSPITYHQLDQLLPGIFESGKVPFLLILDRITDVRNFGAIARSAYCGGVDAIIIPESGAARVNEDAVKTSAGALLKIPVCREKNFKSMMELLNQSGITTIACTEKANKDLPYIDLTGPIAIIMGNEEDGISNEVLRKAALMAKIPLELGVKSLNVSVAAGIAVYETVRQRMME